MGKTDGSHPVRVLNLWQFMTAGIDRLSLSLMGYRTSNMLDWLMREMNRY